MLWLTILYSVTAIAANKNEIILTFMNGDIATVSTTDMPVMTITDGQLSIKGQSVCMEYTLEDLKDYRFGNAGSVETVSDNTTAISMDGNIITVTSDNGKCDVKMYNIDGIELMAKHSADNKCVVDISSFSPGVYILSANGVNTKITKQ